jgi:multidrug efflux pump subunit AcrA (membrane-fusion protein)
MNEDQTKVDRTKIEAGLRVLEDEMKARYSEKAPSVLKPPEGVYRSYKVPPFWKKIKKNLQWGGLAFGLWFLFFPVKQQVPLEGKLIAHEMRVIDAKLDGELILITKSNGASIKKGELIGKLYNSLLHQERERLEAEILTLGTELAGLKQKSESLQSIYSRYKRLYDEGGLSSVEFDLQKIKTQEIENQFKVKEAEYRERKIRMANLEKRLADEVILSPVDGTITSPIAEKLNARVRENDSLCDVAVGGMRFEFKVKEEAVRSIDIGQILPINLEAFPGKTFKGKVDEIRPIVFEDSPKPWMKNCNARVLVSIVTALPAESRFGMTAKSRVRLKERTSRVSRWLRDWEERL